MWRRGVRHDCRPQSADRFLPRSSVSVATLCGRHPRWQHQQHLQTRAHRLAENHTCTSANIGVLQGSILCPKWPTIPHTQRRDVVAKTVEQQTDDAVTKPSNVDRIATKNGHRNNNLSSSSVSTCDQVDSNNTRNKRPGNKDTKRGRHGDQQSNDGATKNSSKFMCPPVSRRAATTHETNDGA